VPSSNGIAVVVRPNAIERCRGAPKQPEVDLQTGEEHQQQLADVRHEVGDRALRAKNAEDIGTYDDATEQQSHGGGDSRETTQPGNADDQDQPKREFRQVRQGQ
jgi:hypothetical protein